MHDAPWEHFHDAGDPLASAEDHVVWATVGLDVGSSTSQILFSQITLERRDGVYVVTDRQVLHESDILLTPYHAEGIIDEQCLAAFIDKEFTKAKLTRAQIDAGAVILTGLALTKENSHAIAHALADDTGRFVAVAAGDILETRLAANGAGVPWLSHQRGAANQQPGILVHIDVGGGTTKLSAWENGKLLGLAAIDIGARLLTYDDDRIITRIEPPCAGLIEDIHLDANVGEYLKPEVEARMAGAMARNILRYSGVLRQPPRGKSLLRTQSLVTQAKMKTLGDGSISAVIVSGGVSEYVYQRETRNFGDLGQQLGAALRAELAQLPVELIPFDRGIRATVVGVSQFSMQLSGNTVFVSNSNLLPLKNIPVVVPHLHLDGNELDTTSIKQAIGDAIDKRFRRDERTLLAVAIRWQGSATFARLTAVASALVNATQEKVMPHDPIIVICDGDVAGVLGHRLQEIAENERGIICLDAVHVHEFDHIDIGEFVAGNKALPVIVKSLLFASAGRTQQSTQSHPPQSQQKNTENHHVDHH